MKANRTLMQICGLCMMFLPPIALHAQFTCVTNNDNTVTITGYVDTNDTVVIPDTINGHPVTGIGPHSFSINFNLSRVTIPSGVTSIGLGAFYYCSGLTNIVIPDTVTNIGEQAFYQCGLTSVTIPNGLKSIAEAVFVFCGNLTNVIIPNSVTNIGNEAFGSCGFASITLPDNVISISRHRFAGFFNRETHEPR
jgi:hypothetical protein